MLAVDAVGDDGLDFALASAARPAHLEYLRLDTDAALDEYLKIYLKLPLSASKLGPFARIMEYVATAAPGVREILTIGKIAWEVRTGRWDTIVVDAPASGHVVELLGAPEELHRVIPNGPLAQQTAWVADIVADATQTQVWLVTTVDALAIIEMGELRARIESETSAEIGRIVANRVPAALSVSQRQWTQERHQRLRRTDSRRRAAEIIVTRAERSERALSEVHAMGYPVTELHEQWDPLEPHAPSVSRDSSVADDAVGRHDRSVVETMAEQIRGLL